MDKNNNADERIITSDDLLKQLNRERAAKGEHALKAVNSAGGATTNNYSKDDKSWNSVPGFFKKAFSHKDGEGKDEKEEDK
ncbi:MAG: hypothetical protein ACSW8G_03120 [Bacillota bacterium]